MNASSPGIATSQRERSSLFSDGMAIVWAIALAKLVLHIYFNNRNGYFRDEFDYMSCGDHLQWGYVDQPPLIPFLTHISRAVLGDSLRAIRFLPALFSSLLVVQAAATTRLLGGRRYALILTAVCVAFAPQYLSNGGLLGTNSLEPNLWLGCAQFVILAIQRNDPRYWIGFGIVAGLGMVLADATAPLFPAFGSCAAAFLRASSLRPTSSFERRARRFFSLAVCWRATLSSM